jgi:hypothetical protein
LAGPGSSSNASEQIRWLHGYLNIRFCRSKSRRANAPAHRDRLGALKKAKKGLITQRQAAEEMGQSERHIRRLLKKLKGRGDPRSNAKTEQAPPACQTVIAPIERLPRKDQFIKQTFKK